MTRIDKPVRIRSVIRKMRGGSQAHLVECQDARLYVAKFQGNPQGNRVLATEWVCHFLLKTLNLSVPGVRLLELPETVSRDPELYFSMDRRYRIGPGVHLGIEVPVDPNKTALFDFLPDRLLSRVGNLNEFGRMLIADIWLCQRDRRQAIFYRGYKRDASAPFRALFIDHGHLLGGPTWEFNDTPDDRVHYYNPCVYRLSQMQEIWDQTVEDIKALDAQRWNDALWGIPPEWLSLEDTQRLSHVLELLALRREHLHELVASHVAWLHELSVKSRDVA